MILSRTPMMLSNLLFAVAAAMLALAVPIGVDLFGPPLALGVFA